MLNGISGRLLNGDIFSAEYQRVLWWLRILVSKELKNILVILLEYWISGSECYLIASIILSSFGFQLDLSDFAGYWRGNSSNTLVYVKALLSG